MQYSGGKELIAGKVAAVLRQLRGDREYYEPFVGGCSIFSRMGCGHASDSNPYLIAMWRAAVAGWIPPSEVSEELYASVRKNKDAYPMELVSFIGFGCSYGGKWFDGYARSRSCRNYAADAARSIAKKVSRMSKVEFACRGYDDFDYPSRCLIYCDPPYASTRNGYADKAWDASAFWGWAARVSSLAMVVVSEYEAPEGFVSIAAFPKRCTMNKEDYAIRSERLFVHESCLGDVRRSGISE